mmetsp:Transcript_31071/g.49980  ORF Transcript_31071/g.49980 Transcript_31071/m.49980 type:complete len:112 (-) Transcript_31071:1856-2191(-)
MSSGAVRRGSGNSSTSATERERRYSGNLGPKQGYSSETIRHSSVRALVKCDASKERIQKPPLHPSPLMNLRNRSLCETNGTPLNTPKNKEEDQPSKPILDQKNSEDSFMRT